MITRKPEVTVICVVYNQVDYIVRALDSVLLQKTSFPYEVIVHDDASDDGTVQILRAYQEKHPNTMRVIFEQENLFSKGIDFFSDLVRNFARGEYIALCEGDDYWLDDRKLQMQWEALACHPECDMCACRAMMVTADGNHDLGEIRPRQENGLLCAEDVILGGGMYLATAGLFFRKSMYDSMMAFEKVKSLDYVYQMKGALRGGIYYLDSLLAAYRRYAKGSQTVCLTESNSMMEWHCEQEKQILRLLDEETNHKYHDVIVERLHDYDDGYYEQLLRHKDKIRKRILSLSGSICMWGRGLRGCALETFCANEGLPLSGVCDITDREVGALTPHGNIVLSVEETLKKADVILASVTSVYDTLLASDFKGTVLNMQVYMPRS